MALPNRHDPTRGLALVDAGERLDTLAHGLDPRRADEDGVHRIVETGEGDVALEGVDLAPNAFRRTVTSRPPRVSWSTVPSSTRSASRIIPAHVPKVGIPPAIRFWSGSNSSKIRASLAIVVDSPPGTTSPSQASSSAGRRTARVAKPSALRTAMCSRTSP